MTDYTRMSSGELLQAVGFNGSKWAEAFVQHVRADPSIATDEGAMTGWFANALMRGYDEWSWSPSELAALAEWMDKHLDTEAAEVYQKQPLAQDWARVAKVTEEAGEAIDALIGLTGQNPRKGVYGTSEDLYDELADVALTAVYALVHFTRSGTTALERVMKRARFHKARVQSR